MPSNARTQYERDGFYLNSARPLPADVVTRAREGMLAIRRGEYDTGLPPEPSPWNPGDSDNILCKIELPQRANRAIYHLVSHPQLGQLAHEITGAKMVQVWWVQLLYKPPTPKAVKVGTNVGWHQDRSYWNAWTADSDLFTAWVALTDVASESGPMIFVPGSHKWGFLPGSDFFAQDLDTLKSNLKTPQGQEWNEIPAILPSGGFSFHDDLTIHGSGPNRSTSPRMSFAIHMRSENSTPTKRGEGLTRYIDDLRVCPIIYKE